VGQGETSACTQRSVLEKLLLDILCRSDKPLTFDEIFEAVRRECETRKFDVRLVLAELVRRGLIERVRGDDVRGLPRMVFKCKPSPGHTVS